MVLAAPITVTFPTGIGVFVRQLRRYAFAASQDKSPVVGLTHASYALILLDALEEVVGRAEIMKLTGVNVDRVRAFIAHWQDVHAKQLQACDPHLRALPPSVRP